MVRNMRKSGRLTTTTSTPIAPFRDEDTSEPAFRLCLPFILLFQISSLLLLGWTSMIMSCLSCLNKFSYVIKYNVLLISLYKFGLVASYVVNPSFQNWKSSFWMERCRCSKVLVTMQLITQRCSMSVQLSTLDRTLHTYYNKKYKEASVRKRYYECTISTT